MVLSEVSNDLLQEWEEFLFIKLTIIVIGGCLVAYSDWPPASRVADSMVLLYLLAGQCHFPADLLFFLICNANDSVEDGYTPSVLVFNGRISVTFLTSDHRIIRLISPLGNTCEHRPSTCLCFDRELPCLR